MPIYTNKRGLPEPLLNAVKNSGYDFDVTNPETISVTQLIDAPYQRKLRQLHDAEIEIDIADEMYALDGNAMHYILEKAGSQFVTELRLTKEIYAGQGRKMTLSGKFDLYDPKSRVLWDYKKTSAWVFVNNALGKESWEAQLNVLKYLMRDYNMPVDSIKICAFVRDWSFADSKTVKGYPQDELLIIDIPIWSEVQVVSYIQDRIQLHLDPDAKHCNDYERWTKKSVFQIKKDEETRSIKNYDTLGEAKLDERVREKGYIVFEKKGEDTRCVKRNYCKVKQWCSYYKENYMN